MRHSPYGKKSDTVRLGIALALTGGVGDPRIEAEAVSRSTEVLAADYLCVFFQLLGPHESDRVRTALTF